MTWKFKAYGGESCKVTVNLYRCWFGSFNHHRTCTYIDRARDSMQHACGGGECELREQSTFYPPEEVELPKVVVVMASGEAKYRECIGSNACDDPVFKSSQVFAIGNHTLRRGIPVAKYLMQQPKIMAFSNGAGANFLHSFHYCPAKSEVPHQQALIRNGFIFFVAQRDFSNVHHLSLSILNKLSEVGDGSRQPEFAG